MDKDGRPHESEMQTCIKRRDGRNREFNRVWDLATSYPSSSVRVTTRGSACSIGETEWELM